MISNLPIHFPPAIAARLLGISLPTFIALGLAPVPYCRKHRRYFRETLELCFGRPITTEMVAAAEAAHAPRLAAYRAANMARKDRLHA
jgi:hypothetical protein